MCEEIKNYRNMVDQLIRSVKYGRKKNREKKLAELNQLLSQCPVSDRHGLIEVGECPLCFRKF